jgi:cysteine desulfurase family protein (TIGR01976 family)
MALDIDFVRRQFPAFTEPSLEEFAHFENAGGSYACGQVVDQLECFYRCTKVQPYYDFEASVEAGRQMDAAKQRMAAWLQVSNNELHFGPSTSQNTYVLAQAMRQHLSTDDEIIVTNQDHEANIGVWSRLADDGIVVREWQVDPDTGELDPADLALLLGRRTRMVAFTHCSNIIGTIHPVREITDLVHQAGAVAVVDGVSFCPHGLPDIPALGADIYLFSLYKVYGPHLGAMFIRDELNANLPFQGHFFNSDKRAYRFTPAGPDHGQIAATNGVMDYVEAVHDHHGDPQCAVETKAANVRKLFRDHETILLQPLLDYLQAHPAIRMFGKVRAEDRVPTVAFTVDGWSASELAAQLGQHGLGVGAGNFYAYRLIEALGVDAEEGVLRVSFIHYTHSDEINRLMHTLDELL